MNHPIASDREEWLAARLALLEREKAHTRERDALAEARQALPKLPVEKEYSFTGPDGPLSLSDLFGPHSQLAVYHFMYGADWDEGCTSCSFWADNLDGVTVHLAHRDTALVLVSQAPFEQLDAYRRRMGWSLRWVSSAGSDFNHDFRVSFTPEELERNEFSYNFKKGGFGGPEAPGLSTFLKEKGQIWHCYSTYGRGLDHFNGAYQLLDLMPKGRDEAALPYTMAWLKRHDQYAG